MMSRLAKDYVARPRPPCGHSRRRPATAPVGQPLNSTGSYRLLGAVACEAGFGSPRAGPPSCRRDTPVPRRALEGRARGALPEGRPQGWPAGVALVALGATLIRPTDAGYSSSAASAGQCCRRTSAARGRGGGRCARPSRAGSPRQCPLADFVARSLSGGEVAALCRGGGEEIVPRRCDMGTSRDRQVARFRGEIEQMIGARGDKPPGTIHRPVRIGSRPWRSSRFHPQPAEQIADAGDFEPGPARSRATPRSSATAFARSRVVRTCSRPCRAARAA